MRAAWWSLQSLFRFDGTVDRRLLSLAAAINVIVLINALLHSPFVGYDALDHLQDIRALAEGRLPSEEETHEFFVPPLPYAGPAMLRAAGVRWGYVVKLAQLQNVAWSVGLTLAVIALCRRLRADDRDLPFWSLVLVGTLPLFYKMFVFVRGEPLLAFLAVVLVERAVSCAQSAGRRAAPWPALGVIAGLCLLSKQWAVFVLAPAAAWLWWRRPADWRGLAAAAAIALAISGWFYASLHVRDGSVAAFNAPPAPAFRLANRSAEFRLDTGWPAMVRGPVRGALDDEHGVTPVVPLLYADSWGDYYGYWVVYGVEPGTGAWASGDNVPLDPRFTNRFRIAAYLGRANIAGLLPTLVMCAGVVAGLGGMLARRSAETAGAGLLATIVLATVAGYVVLLIGYPDLGAKPGYQLHLTAPLGVLGAMVVTSPSRLQRFLKVAIVAAVVHNAPLFVTRFVGFP